MTTIIRFVSPRGVRALAQTTTVAAIAATVSSLMLVAITGSVGLAFFSTFAAVGGAYAARVGWRRL